MTTFKRIIVLAIAALGTAVASATDYTFQREDGVWHDPGNWQPFGIPAAVDQAKIVTGQTCHIVNYDESVHRLVVEAGATLRLEGWTLAMRGSNSSPAEIRLNLEGLMEVTKQSCLQIEKDITLGLNGTVSATGEGNTLRIEAYNPGNIPRLQIDIVDSRRPTIKANITFAVHIRNFGVLLVDADDDLMRFGDGQVTEIRIEGNYQGSFEVSAGRMEFNNTNPAFGCRWIVSGGTLELTELATNNNWLDCAHRVTVGGTGTLSLQRSFGTTANLVFTSAAPQRASIRVAAAKSAEFKKTP